MENPPTNGWRQAAEKFIEPWKDLDCFEGALVTGSYVIGTATPESDIDIHIVLSEQIQWRERGNTFINGYLIEYFANPIYRYSMYLEEDLQAGSKAILAQFTTGQILYDEHGEVAEVVAWAKQQREAVKFPAIDAVRLEILKYHFWDEMDGLCALYNEGSPLFDASAGRLLSEIVKTYATYLQTEIPAFSKIYKFFTDPSVAKAYGMPAFPDPAFPSLFIATLHGERDERFQAIQHLTAYTLEKMGGFEINGWILRTPAR